MDRSALAPKLFTAIMAAFLVPMIWSWGFYEGTKKYSCTMSMKME